MILACPGAYSQREIESGLLEQLREFDESADKGPVMYWTDNRLREVVRLRLVIEGAFPDYIVLYCHGRLYDGRPCRVQLPFWTLPRHCTREELARQALAAGVSRSIYPSLFKALSTLA